MRFRIVGWISLGCLVLVTLGFSIAVSLTASAQGTLTPKTATPQPSPTNNGGGATWSIKDTTFESHFPKGFTFSIDASSSAGKIASGGVIWRHSSDATRTRRPGKVDATTGKVTAEWIPGNDAVPQWVSVEYWWVLTDEAGNTYETPHQVNEYADNTRKWHRAESEDIVIFWQDGVPDAIGKMTIDIMRKQRPFYFSNWGKLLNYKPRAIVYADYKTWEEWNTGVGVTAVSGGVATRIAGQTNAKWGGTAQVLTQRGVRGTALADIPHEVDHLYQAFNGGVYQECWFLEGDATYFETIQDYDYLARVQDMASSGDLPTLQNGGPSCRGANARDAYDIGYAFFKWLQETYGADAHRKVWTLIAQGKSISQALATVTGKDFIDMETDFRAWVGVDNPVPPTIAPTMGFQFQAPPTYEPTAAPKS